jgi:hypothetical protein
MSKSHKSTLLDQARELSVGISRIAEAEKDAVLLRQFEEVEESLRQQTDALQGLVANLTLLQAHKLVASKDLVARGKLASLHRKIENLRKRLQEERSQLMAQNTWASCEKEATELAEALRTKLRTAWTEYLIVQSRNVEAFAHFRQLGGCAEILTEIENLAIAVRASGADLPTTESEFAKVIKLSTRIDALISKLDFGEVPHVVQQFLKRASQGGVPLVELTEEIFSWLQKKKLAGGLKVITGVRPR